MSTKLIGYVSLRRRIVFRKHQHQLLVASEPNGGFVILSEKEAPRSYDDDVYDLLKFPHYIIEGSEVDSFMVTLCVLPKFTSLARTNNNSKYVRLSLSMVGL